MQIMLVKEQESTIRDVSNSGGKKEEEMFQKRDYILFYER